MFKWYTLKTISKLGYINELSPNQFLIEPRPQQNLNIATLCTNYYLMLSNAYLNSVYNN